LEYGLKPHIWFKNIGEIIMNNKNTLSKQHGGIGKLMLFVIVGAIGYGGYIANKKGLVSFDKATSFASSVSSRFSANGNYTGYGVQLMATRELGQAKSVMNDFASDGYSAFVLASKAKGRTIYKVRLGPYSHRPEALAIQDKVVQRYPNNPYVRASLVIYKPN